MTKELKEMIKSNKFPRECFTPAQRANMRSINLIDFMYWYDSSMLVKLRGNIRLKSNNSVVLYEKWAIDFADNNRYVSGIDFCIEYLGLSTYGAMYVINEYLKTPHTASHLVEQLTTIEDIERGIAKGRFFPANQCKPIYAYLCSTRGIPTRTVHRFLKENSLYAEKLHNGYNLLFPMYDDEEKIIGFERTGILTDEDKRFKGCLITEEHIAFTFYYKYIPRAEEKYYAFESAIDLMSFTALVEDGLIELPEDKTIVFISLRGVHKVVLEKYTTPDSDIVLCVDNDTAGEKLHQALKDECKNLIYTGDILKSYGVKDWNDLLKIKDQITAPIKL